MKNKSILVIDDEVEMTLILKEYLTDYGFQVMACTTVDDAKLFLKCNPIHLVLTDLKMPKKSGLDFLREFREEFDPDKIIPFVIMTAYASSICVEETLRLGVTKLVDKPFSLKDISLLITELVETTNTAGSKLSLSDSLAEKSRSHG